MPIIVVWGQMPTALGGSASAANPQVRTDLLDLAVWQEVCTLLAHPERLAEEYRRRLHAPGRTKRQEQPTLDAQIGKLRQGLARLIDSYAEGLIEKQEFAPRITRLRQRLTAFEEQAQQLQDDAALHTELRLIIGRLEDFAAQVHDGLAAADWTSKRELIRALVKRVEVTQDQVNVVFRVDQHPAEPAPGKKSLQLRRGSSVAHVSQCILASCPGRMVCQGRPPRMQGHCFLTRFADDFIIGCERETDARRIMAVLPKRFTRFRLTIPPEKTALIAFKRPPSQRPIGRGHGYI